MNHVARFGWLPLFLVLVACGVPDSGRSAQSASAYPMPTLSSEHATQTAVIAAYDAPQPYPMITPTFGTFTEVIADYAYAPRLAVVLDPQFVVIAVEPGGIAESLGVQVGDVLRSVDGTATEPANAPIKEALASKQPGDPIDGVVVRNGAELTLHGTVVPYNRPIRPASDGSSIATATPVPQGYDFL